MVRFRAKVGIWNDHLISGSSWYFVMLQNTPDMVFTEMNDTSTDLALHTFWINDTSLTAQLFVDIGSLKDVVLQLYIGYDYEPNINNYDFTTVLPEGKCSTFTTLSMYGVFGMIVLGPN